MGSPSTDRRISGLLRIPFIQRCSLEFDDGHSSVAFMVNINLQGAYLAEDHLPRLGQGVRCRFRIPGNELEIDTGGLVAWVNARQQHPVHSLPPGFGVKFRDMSPQDWSRIERLVFDYLSRNPQAR